MMSGDSNNMPSGRILAEYRNKKQTCELPSTGGYKEHCPLPGNWAQSKRLERLQEAHYDVINELRVAKNKQLAKGRLIDNLVEIEGASGPYWRFIGFSENKRNFLHPEEAVYLMESSCLEVFHHGLPLSGERLYTWMLGSVRMEEYLVYSHLMRLGYVVRRFDRDHVVTEYERKINLDQHLVRGKRKKSRGKDYAKKAKTDGQDLTSKVNSGGLSADVADEHFESGIDNESETTLKVDNGSNYKEIDVDCEFSRDSQCTAEEMLRIKKCSDMVSEFYKYTVTNVCEFLEKDLWSFCLGSGNDKALATWPEMPVVKACDDDRAFVGNEKLSQAKNWTEYKALRDELSQNFQPPTKYLWDDDIQPLNSPETNGDIFCIRKNLQIIHSVSDFEFNSKPKYEISFDVYTPAQKANFKKSGTISPAYRVVVMGEGSMPPELADVVSMRTKDGVPLLWVVTDNGNVHFYSFQQVEIPEDGPGKR